MDIVTPERRSRMMSRIRGKDTKPELSVRKIAHALGYRFRLHRRDLPGTPDLVFLSLRKVIFVHGCFWHQHLGCKCSYTPKTNTEFWTTKLNANVRRDAVASEALKDAGWEVLVIWECELADLSAVSNRIRAFLTQGSMIHSSNGGKNKYD